MQQDILPPTAVETTGDTQRLTLAQDLLDSIQAQIRAADEKVRVLFGGSALLAAALAFDRTGRLTQVALNATSPLALLVIALYVALLLAVAATVIAAIFALLPRVQLGRIDRSLFFFGHIAATSHDAFIDEFATLSHDALLRQTLSQIHTNSLIVATKHLWTRRATIAFAVAVVMLIIEQGLALFI